MKILLIALAVACLPLTVLPSLANAGQGGVQFSTGHGQRARGVTSGRHGGGHKAHRSARRHRDGRVERRRHRSGGDNITFKRSRERGHRRGFGHRRVFGHFGGLYGSGGFYSYGRRYGYGDDGDYRTRSASRYDGGAAPGGDEDQGPAEQPRPVVPKWIHLGPSEIDEGSGEDTSGNGESQALTNCLTVKTDVTVDGVPMEAFGRACLAPDGTWRLEPIDPGS